MEKTQRRPGATGVQGEKGNEAERIQGSRALDDQAQKEKCGYFLLQEAELQLQNRHDTLTVVIREN